MSEKDGKDCKHEKIRTYCDYGGNTVFECKNPNCDKELKETEVVIRTKAYDQARENVIADGWKTWENYNPHAYYSDGPRNLERVTVARDALFDLHTALDALGGK